MKSGKTAHFAAKRALDIAVSLTALTILLPLFLLVCVAIRLESPGSPIFSQVRWGVNGKRIRIYKLRSMRTDMCDATGVAQTTKNDPRITRLGAILRKTSIDELPQLLNVLLGQMSLVGPRCHAIGMLAADRLYEDLVPHYHDRHMVKPGLTGLAQVRGFRGPTTDPVKARARIACDIYYVHNFTFWMDVNIIVKTVWSELRGGTGF
ncbi:exopolysaccharide biosynthesis protein [Rhizobium sp. Leaf384]|uniref:sugar transferase n=1 Tax=unclassified Rhizobium TaxID=2613769 RepID=UPI00071268FF|nr:MULTISPECIES: sugar transferase [unclassified Rhizobium]KQS81512.1 exopolysaccharide biosynthesis protein [Rhizobium sp. Leaf384]KQS82959.1 exopolysaccharide biosynthesis protein [Rhizobium sp. Leaf383]